MQYWREYTYRRGSLNTGRRVEQAVGRLMALYINSKTKKEHHVEDSVFMPHEDRKVLTYEEERLKQIKKKSG
ncbi:MAG: hypothetical protein H9855_01015 [Candidatus Acinetobacter avistercoris]|nr:hypothetical protein [Candidatus Acinetobacter avistercoris]